MDHVSRLEAALAANHLYDEMRADVQEVVAEVKRLRGEVAQKDKEWEIRLREAVKREWEHWQAHIARLEGALEEVKLLWQSFRGNPSPQNMKECATRLDEALTPAQEGEEGQVIIEIDEDGKVSRRRL